MSPRHQRSSENVYVCVEEGALHNGKKLLSREKQILSLKKNPVLKKGSSYKELIRGQLLKAKDMVS